jgi:hypothetical protein
MKKLLTATLALLVLAAFTGLSVGYNKKAGEAPAAYPPADTVTLSATPNMVSKNGCPVTAKPGRTNTAFIYPSYHYVNFEKFVGTSPSNPWVPWNPNMVTNSQGVTLPRTVPWNTKIRAWIQKVSPNHDKAYSNEFTCSEQNPKG